MINCIVCAKKIDKLISKEPVVMNGTLNTTVFTPNSHDKCNQNIDVSSKYPITTEKGYSPGNYLLHTTHDIIQTKPL